MGTLRYGTSSWSTAGWVGSFYPEGTRPKEFLGEYAKVFSVVEADTTYYRVPSVATVEGWRERTPEGFVIAAKFPRSIVHGGGGRYPDASVVLVPAQVRDDTSRFLDAMDRLEDKAGPLLLQFPYFNRAAFAAPELFLERLDTFLGLLLTAVGEQVDMGYVFANNHFAGHGPATVRELAALVG